MQYHHITSEVLLEKLLEMQQELLLKQPLFDVISKHKSFLLHYAQAEFIGISLKGRDSLYEFTCKLGDSHGLMEHIKFSHITTNSILRLLKNTSTHYKVLTSKTLCDLFALSSSCKEIDTILNNKKVVLGFLENSPLHEQMVATVFIILPEENLNINSIDKSCETARVIWEVIVPFYDHQTGQLFQHCIHEDLMFDTLTKREKEIAHLLINGYTQAEIAEKISLSINTVKTHIKNIYIKFGVNSRIDFVNSLFKR